MFTDMLLLESERYIYITAKLVVIFFRSTRTSYRVPSITVY